MEDVFSKAAKRTEVSASVEYAGDGKQQGMIAATRP